MFQHDKLITIKITDNVKGITHKIRTPYNRTWSKGAVLEHMFDDMTPYFYWYTHFCFIERPNLLPTDKFWETMTNNFKDILTSIESTTLEAVEFECDNLPTKELMIKDAKVGYREFQNRTFIRQIMEMYPEEYEYYSKTLDMVSVDAKKMRKQMRINREKNIPSQEELMKKLRDEREDDINLFIESVFDDFHKKYQRIEKYLVSFHNDDIAYFNEDEITFSNVLNEDEDEKIEYILNEYSFNHFFLEATMFVKPDIKSLPVDEYWDKFHEVYVAARDNLKNVIVNISGDLKYTFTYDELLRIFNRYCYKVKRATLKSQAEFILKDDVEAYHQRYIELSEKVEENCLNYEDSEERFYKLWNEENNDTPERVAKLTEELIEKYLGTEDTL